GTPSLFEQEASREFYRGLVMDDAFWPLVDFRLLHAGERLVAAHFGFFHAGRFLWYKPSFDPELGSLGAGEVLLKHLITAAAAEGAQEFDFTRGNEGFKQRFATVTRMNHWVCRPGLWDKLRSAAKRGRDWARAQKAKRPQAATPPSAPATE
ncbi:MAG: GNAT family N-acetyltransferase, partial [Prosthecobacter sp.]